MNQQLSLFEQLQLQEMRAELDAVKAILASVRRGLFGRFDKLQSDLISIKEDQHVFSEFLGEDMEKMRVKYSKKPDIDWVESMNA